MTSLHPRRDQPRLLRLDGRYRLLEPLGHGGTASVWRGLDERLSRPVAVKIVRGMRHNGIRSEAQALALLSHPHIAAVYDYGFSHRQHYIVMELVRGRPMSAALDAGPLPWVDAVRSCAQVAAALAVAHERGLVHRDVTPSNIMLTPSGAKLIDFGISAVAGDQERDREGDVYGTPPFVAPERLRNRTVAPPVDVFALGIVLYRALSGRLPWHASGTARLVALQQSTDPAELPNVDGLPAEVAKACMQCLSYDPANRPSAAQLADLLSTASDQPAAVTIESPTQLTTETLIPTGSLPATGAWTPTDALAASDALAPIDAQLRGPLRLTRAMPGTRVETSVGVPSRHPWLRRAATAVALLVLCALAWFVTDVGPSDRPVPSEAAGPPAPGRTEVRPSAASGAAALLDRSTPQNTPTAGVPGAATGGPAPARPKATPNGRNHSAPPGRAAGQSRSSKDDDQGQG